MNPESVLPPTDDQFLSYVALYLQQDPVSYDHAEFLAYQMVRGREAKVRLTLGGSLTRQQMGELNQYVYEGEQAKDELLNTHLRVVVSVVCSIYGKGPLLMDLISEGNALMVRLIEQFDPRRGVFFNVYVRKTLAFELRRFEREVGVSLHMPRHFAQQLMQGRAVYLELEEHLGTQPDQATFCAVFGGKPKLAMRVFEAIHTLRESEHLLENLPDSEQDLHEVQAAQLTVERLALRRALDTLLLELPEAMGRVIRLRVGYDGGAPLSLQEIAAQEGLSHDRVKRLSAEGVAMLRNLARRHRLDLFD